MYEMGMYAWYGEGVVCALDGNLCMVWGWVVCAWDGNVCMVWGWVVYVWDENVCMGVGMYVPMYVWVHSKAVRKEGREVEA
jgi:hypothetical protein